MARPSIPPTHTPTPSPDLPRTQMAAGVKGLLEIDTSHEVMLVLPAMLLTFLLRRSHRWTKFLPAAFAVPLLLGLATVLFHAIRCTFAVPMDVAQVMVVVVVVVVVVWCGVVWCGVVVWCGFAGE